MDGDIEAAHQTELEQVQILHNANQILTELEEKEHELIKFRLG